MNIIGFLGFKGAGKDTAAGVLCIEDLLVNSHLSVFKKLAFADAVKDLIAVTFGWDREMLDGSTPGSREWREQVDPWWADRLGIPHFTPRFAMTDIGTRVMRQHVHDDIWILSLIKRMEQLNHDNIVITDCRFPNEIAMLRKLGAKFIHVQKEQLPEYWQFSSVPANDPLRLQAVCMMENKYRHVHISEWAWNNQVVDLTIANDGSVGSLHKKVLNYVESVF